MLHQNSYDLIPIRVRPSVIWIFRLLFSQDSSRLWPGGFSAGGSYKQCITSV